MGKKFNVLVPRYKEAGTRDEKGNMQYWVSWKKVGEADSMVEAKKITKLPVLEDRNKRVRVSK